jgi:hypothetical protein
MRHAKKSELEQVDLIEYWLYFARPHLRFSDALFCPIAALRKQLHSMAMRLFSRLALEQNSLAIKPANMTVRSIKDTYFLCM